MSDPLSKLSERLDRLLRWRVIALALLLAAAALGVASARAVREGIEPGVREVDALEQAVMARQLAQGQGFRTNVIYPAELALGADAGHPAVRQPPFWPLVLAVPFALFGADAGTADATSVALFGLLVATASGLAAARAGLLAGAVTALAVAFTSSSRLLTLEPTSSTLFAVMIALVLWLCAAGAPAFAIGLACGLAYLTRYGGILLLPAALALVFARSRHPRLVLVCMAGFLVAALPWWIRNLVVTGHPFYTLQSLAPWTAPGPPAAGIGPLFELNPAPGADPLVKLTTQLPLLLTVLPFANVNLAGFAGVLFGAMRDAFCAVCAALGLAALLLAAATVPNGGVVAPYFPAMIALGAAAWMRYGGWLRVPALALVAAAAWLPAWPDEPRDLRQLRNTQEYLLDSSTHESAAARDALRRCLDGAPKVLAHGAPRVAWQTDAIALYAPVADSVFWEIVERHDVAFVQGNRPTGSDVERFAAEFSPRRDCAPDLYERKRAAH